MRAFIVLLGPPGAGKGTQAEALCGKTGLTHVSSGDIFRENLKNKTDLGKVAESFMNRGELVPDDITIRMIKERLSRPDCKEGAVLDGFPRTPAQAEALAGMLDQLRGKVQAVPYIKVSEEVLIERLAGRWTCRAEGHIFHQKFNPPKEAGRCDIDGSELYQREDDKEETVKRRIRVYLELTEPLINYYRQHKLLIEVDGSAPIQQVTDELLASLPELK